ncbi:MAG: PEP-CTERM sorting domain-containing protein [Myxococcota bacterium]
MKNRLKKLAFATVLAALVAGPATAGLVAGWDFSDLSGDSASIPANHPANYVGTATASALNVTGDVIASAMRPGAAEADQAGLQGGINGFDSAVDPTWAPGETSFDRRGEPLGLTARSVATAEFDFTLAAPVADNWIVTFGGDALSATGSATTIVDVAFGGSCAGAASVASATLQPGDTEVSMWLGTLGSAGGCVVLSMDGSSTQPLIDNVAISTVPEPGMGWMLVAGAAGLITAARRRAR